MITKDGRDTPLEKLTKELYLVPKGEERYYHVLIEMKQFDPKTARRLSTPRVQKFGKKIFDAHVHESLIKQGYSLEILHDPTEWIKAMKAKAAEARATKKAEEEERFKAAVAAEVARQLAEAQKATEATKPAPAEGEKTKKSE